jgi:hypothetical protein
MAGSIDVTIDEGELSKAVAGLLSEPGFAERVFETLGDGFPEQLPDLLSRLVVADLAPAARTGEYVARFRVLWPGERDVATATVDGGRGGVGGHG